MFQLSYDPFLCTSNTARSQMAQALQEVGLPTDHLQSKGVKPMLGQHFTYLVTVCDRAEKTSWPEINSRASSLARFTRCWRRRGCTAHGCARS